jgi:hypothetical protein
MTGLWIFLRSRPSIHATPLGTTSVAFFSTDTRGFVGSSVAGQRGATLIVTRCCTRDSSSLSLGVGRGFSS